MGYDKTHRGLRLKPSSDGCINFTKLTRRTTRATLLGCSPDGRFILLQRDGIKIRERWARSFWIPLRGNRQWN